VGEGGFDLVMVRRSGPVQSMKFKSWWIYFLFLVLILMLAGLGAGSYLLYRQQSALHEISEDTRLLMLRAERLEALVQEQETRALLAQQAEEERQAAQAAHQPAREKPPAAAEEQAEAPAENPAPEQERSSLPPEPSESDRVGIANVELSSQGRELVVVFDVTNKLEPDDPAMGYVTVVARAQRGAKPWIEAWPPQRLTPLGRPLNYRRGTPFSVQRFRRLKAKFATGDKEFQRLEFLVYSREGDLLLVHQMDLTSQDEAAGPGAAPGVSA
jgi:hypothetical protein